MIKLKKDLVIANLFLLNIIFGISLITSLLSVYLNKIGISLTNVGLILAFGAILAGFLRLPIGYAVDRYGKKKFIILGAFGFPLFAIGLTIAKTVPHFIGLDILLEIFGAVCWTAFSAYYFDLLSKGREGAELSQRNIGYYLATAAAPFTAGLIADNFGFANLFYTGALICMSAILIAAVYIKSDGHRQFIKFKKLEDEYTDILKIKGFRASLFVMFMNNFTWTFWVIYMPIYLNNHGYSFSQIGFIITVMWIVGAFMQIPLGKAIDKFPVKWLLIPGFGLVFLGGLIFFSLKQYITYIIGRAVSGIGWDLSYWPAVGLFAKSTPKKEHGAAWAALTAAMAIAYGIGSITGGFLTDRFGIEKILYFAMFLALASGIIVIFSKTLAGKGQKFYRRHHILRSHIK